MDRVAFTIFGLSIYWYAIMITTGMIVGCSSVLLLCKRKGFNPDTILDILLVTIPIAIIGARLYYVVFDWDETWTFARIFQTREGGMAIYGGVLAGSITAVIMCRVKKLTLKDGLAVLDCLVVGLIIGQSIGRWGNFINQEAYGNLITNPAWQFFPMAVHVGDNWYQATFFYESMWNLIGYIALFAFVWKKPRISGVSTCLYFIYYGIGRFWIEGLRSDSLYFMKNTLGEFIRVSQVLSLVLMLAGGVALYFVIKYNKSGVLTNNQPLWTFGQKAVAVESTEAVETVETADNSVEDTEDNEEK